MQHMRKSTMSRMIAYLVAATLLTPQMLLCLTPAGAQGMKQVTGVAVIPFADHSGSGKVFIGRDMTSAAALALEDTREFTVTSTADLEREMSAMRLAAPLSKAEQIRLGDRLQVEKVLVGDIDRVSVDAASGRCQVDARIMMLDVAVGEYLDGAIASVVTKPIPGWNGDVNQALHEAMRETAESAVAKMLSARVRRGNVDMVDDLGYININLGADDGLTGDTDMLVMRPQWQPDLEKSILRRVGVIRISDLESNMATCRTMEGSTPTSGDKVYRIYKPMAAMKQVARSRSIKKTGQLAAGILLLAGLLGVVGGPTNSTASTVTGALTQSRPGADPFVRLKINTGNTAREKTHGYLVFRAANNPDFPAIADYLIDALAGKTLDYYSDEAFAMRVVESYEIQFQYRNEDGDFEDGTVTVSYNDEPLVQGTRYFYRVQRITDPLYPPGTNPPISSAQEPADPEINPTPDWRIISQASVAAGPLTFFVPPSLSTPSDGASNQLTQNVTFTWQPSTGANEYVVEVFPSSDPDGISAPVFQSAPKRDTGSTLMNATITGPFSTSQTYWWRVGARQTGDRYLPVNQLNGKTGWLYSNMRSFTTAATPPPPPGTTGTAQPNPVPGQHRGPWGGASRTRR